MTCIADGNGLDFELAPVERLLVRTPLLALGEFRCPTDAAQFRGGGPQPCAYVAFPRTPVKISPNRGRPEICTPAIAAYYNEGDSYDRHAVGERGDNSDWIALSRSLMDELTGASSRPGFAGCFAPVGNQDFLLQQRLFRRASSGQRVTELEVEETVLFLLQRLLANAASDWSRQGTDQPWSRPANERRRCRMVEDAKQLIAEGYREELSLSELARRVNGSPGYLARSFHDLAGTTVHNYRTQLRLRGALALLPDYRHDIAALALDLGFSSHSHFGDVFRRQFGLTPSDYAARLRLN